jgi:hypothetical protein
LRIGEPAARAWVLNTGAKALIISDLRLVIEDKPERVPLGWITTRTRPGGDPHCGAALRGAGGTGGRALGEPRFEHSGELPDSATVGVLGERAALSLGRDAAPLFFVREEMPNLVH